MYVIGSTELRQELGLKEHGNTAFTSIKDYGIGVDIGVTKGLGLAFASLPFLALLEQFKPVFWLLVLYDL